MQREKIITLVNVAEKILIDMDIYNFEYIKIKDAIAFCRSWIDGAPVEEVRIYEFLDDEDEDDLVGYYIGADNEKDKREFGIVLGVMSCVAVDILETQKSSVPQFLEGVDEKYYEALMRDIEEYIRRTGL